MKNKLLIIVIAAMVWSVGPLMAAPNATHAPDHVKGLQAGWDWALAAAKNASDGFYIAYSILREEEDDGDVCIGHGKSDKTFFQYIHGKKPGQEQLKQLGRETAILFRYHKPTRSALDFDNVKMTGMNSDADLDDKPVFWLGQQAKDPSIAFLEKSFNSARTKDNRKHLVAAIGIHGPSARGFRFLKSVLTGNYALKVRKDAAFWIGLQHSADSVKLLTRTVRSDSSEKIREQAVFGLFLNKHESSAGVLVDLAKNSKEKEVRKKAIFWLGQKAVEKTEELLADVVNNEKDSDIQEAAVFALSRHPKGVDKLLKLADSHRSFNVRKSAIFWLGQSGDPRALDLILKILKK